MLGRLRRGLFVAGLAPALWATAARAQDRVPGAVPGASATGSIGGRFTLRGVRLGIVTIEVRRLGLAPLTSVSVADGAQEDVLRAVSIAPGVGVTSAGVTASLSAGEFGARLGDRTSSATTLTLREGNRERIAGELNVAATHYGALIEGPLGKTASFLANVRKRYFDLLFNAFGISFIPSYTDATVKVVWRPATQDAFSFLTIAARSTISFDNSTDAGRVTNSQVVNPGQEQYFSGITWKRLLSRGVATTTFGRTWTRYATAHRDSLLVPILESRHELQRMAQWDVSAGGVASGAAAPAVGRRAQRLVRISRQRRTIRATRQRLVAR